MTDEASQTAVFVYGCLEYPSRCNGIAKVSYLLHIDAGAAPLSQPKKTGVRDEPLPIKK